MRDAIKEEVRLNEIQDLHPTSQSSSVIILFPFGDVR